MGKVCRPCRLRKASKLPVLGKFERATNVGDIVLSDIVNPLLPSFPDRFRYVSGFVDDHSRHAVLRFMVHRSRITELFLGVNQKLKQLGGDHVHIENLHLDNAE